MIPIMQKLTENDKIKYCQVTADFIKKGDFEEKIPLLLDVLDVKSIISLFNYTTENGGDVAVYLTKVLKLLEEIMLDRKLLESLSVKSVKAIVTSENIDVSEDVLFCLLEERSRYGPDSTEIKMLLSHIRFETLPFDFLLKTVRCSKLVDNETLLDIIRDHDSALVGSKRGTEEIRFWIAPSGTYKAGFRTVNTNDVKKINSKFVDAFVKSVTTGSGLCALVDFKTDGLTIAIDFVELRYNTSNFPKVLALLYSTEYKKGSQYMTNFSQSLTVNTFEFNPRYRADPEHLDLYVTKNTTF